MLNSFKEAARPLSICASTLAVCVGIFVTSATLEKLMVAATIAGGVAYLRSTELR